MPVAGSGIRVPEHKTIVYDRVGAKKNVYNAQRENKYKLDSTIAPREERKKRKNKKGAVLVFDENAIRDFVGGMHKRKLARKKEGARQHAEKALVDRRLRRKEVQKLACVFSHRLVFVFAY